MNEKQMAKILIKELSELGFTIHRYNAITTSSIYLKLDYGICCGIRISNHSGKKKYHYRFNIVKGYNGDKVTYSKNLISYFYTFEQISQLIKDVQHERNKKIQRYGLNNYKKYMEIEKEINPLFQRFKQVIWKEQKIWKV